MSGWIKLHREITDHWIYKDAEIMYFWIRLLMDANFKDNKTVFNGSLITVKRGELIFGLDSYSKKTNISIKKLRRFIKLLEQDGMLGRVKFAKYSVISITNYDKYQEGAGKGQAEGIERASKGQHYKKDNKGKNVNNIIPFDDFYRIYPKKVDKKKCESKWNTLKITPEIFSDIKRHLAVAYVQTEKQFIPSPLAYINGEKWNDEILSQSRNNFNQPARPASKPFPGINQ